MTGVTLPIEAFAKFFEGHLVQLNKTYDWPVRQPVQDLMPDFNWYQISGGAEESIALKHHLTRKWADADDGEKARLALWIVREWGRIKGNRSKTMTAHVARVLDPNSDRPLKGVASYSKILSVASCTQYAIYDARVAVSLNVIQLLENFEKPIYFHYVPSQKGIINRFMKEVPPFELLSQRGWQKVDKDENYKTYLELLNGLKTYFLGKEIYHFEMVLFGLAPEFCENYLNG